MLQVNEYYLNFDLETFVILKYKISFRTHSRLKRVNKQITKFS